MATAGIGVAYMYLLNLSLNKSIGQTPAFIRRKSPLNSKQALSSVSEEFKTREAALVLCLIIYLTHQRAL